MLAAEIRTLLTAVLAPSTQAVYARAWALFGQYRQHMAQPYLGIAELPISVHETANYIAALRLRGMAPTTIISYTTAIGYTHRMAGLADPTSATVVQKLLSAATRLSATSDTRLPITLTVLHRLVEALKCTIPDAYTRAMLTAMFVVAFFGLMRVGEITLARSGQVSLTLDQVKRQGNHIAITIAAFKHNANRQPMEIILPAQDQVQICPVQALLVYLQHRGTLPGPLFAFADGQPIPRFFSASKLKLAIQFCGLDAGRYKTHSFRIGGASYYASLGYSDSQIRILGRWKSDAFKRYIRGQIVHAQHV